MSGMQSRCVLPCCYFSYLSEKEQGLWGVKESGGQDKYVDHKVVAQGGETAKQQDRLYCEGI